MPIKKLKLKKKVIHIAIIIFIVFSLGIFLTIFGINLYKTNQYKKTNEYKLIELGYSKEDALTLLNHFKEENEIKFLLENKKNDYLIPLINEKYYLKKNLDRYLSYITKNKNISIKDVVSLVNVNRDFNYYENKLETDLTKDILMNVNKYYYLSEEYIPNNLEKISVKYSYAGNMLESRANNAFLELCNNASKLNYTFVAVLSYRSYEAQSNSYKKVRNSKGEREADKVVARPGHSEHQTGLALNIELKNMEEGSVLEETDGYKWLEENAYLYGFILRYPKDKENITGFSYETSHFRYVGVDVARIIKNENITFDEYYAYYVEN